MKAILRAVAMMVACGLCFPLYAQDIQQSRGQDPRVDYPSLARYGEWDYRN